MRNIAIFGGGGFGREVKMLIDQINQNSASFNFVGYFDDGMPKNTLVNGNIVLGGINELNQYVGLLDIVFAIGNPVTKEKIVNKITKTDLNFPILIHPSVLIGADGVCIGEGSIICAGNIITVNATIGKHVILNLGCTVGHDSSIGDYSSFMPGINISGEVLIHTGVFGGTGSKIINQVEIGKYSIIGAGAVVSKSIPPYCTAVGIPAKPIKFHNPI